MIGGLRNTRGHDLLRLAQRRGSCVLLGLSGPSGDSDLALKELDILRDIITDPREIDRPTAAGVEVGLVDAVAGSFLELCEERAGAVMEDEKHWLIIVSVKLLLCYRPRCLPSKSL